MKMPFFALIGIGPPAKTVLPVTVVPVPPLSMPFSS
jgi:hypothetical protein